VREPSSELVAWLAGQPELLASTHNEHQPTRYRTACLACGRPWPCGTAGAVTAALMLPLALWRVRVQRFDPVTVTGYVPLGPRLLGVRSACDVTLF
jgi:hypothetical protein